MEANGEKGAGGGGRGGEERDAHRSRRTEKGRSEGGRSEGRGRGRHEHCTYCEITHGAARVFVSNSCTYIISIIE